MGNFHVKMDGIFSGQKVIHNTFLNLIGLHVFRILLSRLFYSIRSMLIFSELSDDQKTLRQDGIIIIKNFLPNEKFRAIKHEFENAKNFDGTDSEINDGDSIWTRRKFNRLQYSKLSNTNNFLSDSRLLDLISVGEARKVTPDAIWFDEMYYPEKKIAGKHEAANAELAHIDVFFHAHKSMYFIDDVSDEDGPFNFSPGSQHLSVKRLWFEYKKSIGHKKPENSGFQANEKDRIFLGLKNIKAIVPANTLVVFDGCAFHKRGDALVGSRRSAIFLQFRYNPFSLKTIIKPKIK
jgi:hypothetical protein